MKRRCAALTSRRRADVAAVNPDFVKHHMQAGAADERQGSARTSFAATPQR
jgi:hypothetical protein